MDKDKRKLLEKLAVFHGLVMEDLNRNGQARQPKITECQAFLHSVGVTVDSVEAIEQELEKIERETIGSVLPPLQIELYGKAPLVKIRIPEGKLNRSYEWILITEEGRTHRGEFYGAHLAVSGKDLFKGETYFLLDLSLPIQLDMGYHTLKIMSDPGRENSMRLIVVPQECYKPLLLKEKRKPKGIKFDLLRTHPQSPYRISSYKDLTRVTNYCAANELDAVSVHSLHQVYCSEESAFVDDAPSSKLLFNTLLLDVDALLATVGAGKLKLQLLSQEFQEKFKEVQEKEEPNIGKIYRLKTEIFKLIYKSFRENHINKNSEPAQEFFRYVSEKGNDLRKPALFEALREYFLAEDSKLLCWRDWPKVYQNPESEAVVLFENNNPETIQYYEFLQWQADIQLAEAGRASWTNKLGLGICAELSFHVDGDGADAWLYQNTFSFSANTLEGNEKKLKLPPMFPSVFRGNGYEILSKSLRRNMAHCGALKINNVQGFSRLDWTTPEAVFTVRYPFEEILGIIALESHRNECAVFVEGDDLLMEEKKIIEKFGFFNESNMDLEPLSEVSDLKALFESIQLEEERLKKIDEKKRMSSHKIPLAVYRIQFNKNFTFKDARDLVSYWRDLGISHCYASPLLCPNKGSMHGYDIINHATLNPELGTMQEFREFTDTLRQHGMGLVVDIVPNHMGIGNANIWWMDVLENGQASKFAPFLDIDWRPIKKELAGKVLVAVLGDHYGNVLQKGQFRFHFSEETGKLKLTYWDHEFPINPSSYPLFLEHRIEILESRLGTGNPDLMEYQSIINAFKKLPDINENTPEKVFERNREKDIASRRLSELTRKTPLLLEFTRENLVEFVGKAEDPIACNRIHHLLERQAYRLAYWRVSSDIINYRRFFDVNNLICLKTEDPLVFSSTHGLIFDLIEQGKINGLRIDHPDGLLDPTGYFLALQQEAGKRLGLGYTEAEEDVISSEKLPIYVVAEKILASFEKVPKDWAIHGTVGYEFLNDACHLLVSRENEKKFTKTYHRFTGTAPDFKELVIECKKLIMKISLAGELNTLSSFLNRISEKNYSARDYTLNGLRNALMEVIACFPVYRTYIRRDETSEKSENYIRWAVGTAKKRSHSTDPSIYDFIEKVLLLQFESDSTTEDYEDILKFTMAFQQYTGPLMAKGLEDTCFYRFNRFTALNEVGGEPERFGITTEEFHNNNLSRWERTPHAFLATSTHDTKRSEDVRARICAISETPEQWQAITTKWARLNKSKKSIVDGMMAPDNNDEYLFYQTLIGVWPSVLPSEDIRSDIIARLEDYMIKAIREAKTHTSWININMPYEEAVKNFIRKVLTSPRRHPFWKEFIPFHEKVCRAGYIYSLSQTTLKLTCPGVPDIYQGNEIFQFDLVDPDNRRPVDFMACRRALEEIKGLQRENNATGLNYEQALLPLESGKIKLFITACLLRFRQAHSDLFLMGDYLPVKTGGKYSDSVVAFARRHEKEGIIVVVSRLTQEMPTEERRFPLGDGAWGDTEIKLPESLSDRVFYNILDHSEIKVFGSSARIGNILNNFTVAVLYYREN